MLLDLCLCNPLSSLLIGVECNCLLLGSSALRHKSYLSLFLLVLHHSWLLLFGWWICGSWICCCLILPTFLLPWFLSLSSLSSHSHVCYLWLIFMSISLHFCSTLTLLIDVSLCWLISLGQTHFSPFPLHSKGTALGKHGSLLLIIERVW